MGVDQGIAPGHNVRDLVWIVWKPENNILELKNKFKMKGTFRRPSNLKNCEF